jgi:hypothetical protein
MPKAEFKREVIKHLTGKDTEPWEMLYFKVYKSQLAVIEQALETASMMLGGQKARGYCLEMICADFLAGAHLEDPSPNMLLLSIRRLLGLIPPSEKAALLQEVEESACRP